MKDIDINLPKPCPIKCVSQKLPDVLYNHITEKINRINEILSNPIKYKEKFKNVEFALFEADIWGFDEAYELNKFSDIVEHLISPKMVEIWNKCYKLNQKSLPRLFIFVQNQYYYVLGKAHCKLRTEEGKRCKKRSDKRSELSKDPSELISASAKLIFLLEQFNSIVSPDCADCFEDMDISDPANEIFLKDGEIPYHMDWDLYITDEEYKTLMKILYKMVEKLNNRKIKNQTEYKKNIRFLNYPKTRKNKIKNAPQILMIRLLYIEFIELFNKPMYKEISIIISELFQSEYTENDIIKLTQPVRDKIKAVKTYYKKNGFIRYYDSSHIEEFIYKNL